MIYTYFIASDVALFVPPLLLIFFTFWFRNSNQTLVKKFNLALVASILLQAIIISLVYLFGHNLNVLSLSSPYIGFYEYFVSSILMQSLVVIACSVYILKKMRETIDGSSFVFLPTSYLVVGVCITLANSGYAGPVFMLVGACLLLSFYFFYQSSKKEDAVASSYRVIGAVAFLSVFGLLVSIFTMSSFFNTDKIHSANSVLSDTR
jgi:hypothetical protein